MKTLACQNQISGSPKYRSPETMKYLGIFAKNGNTYIRNGTKISFEWEQDTNKVRLMHNNTLISLSVEKETKGCSIDDKRFSEDTVNIVAFDSSTKYINHGSNATPGRSDTEFCREDQLACKSGERCLDDPAWVCDDLQDCDDNTDEDNKLCNERALCCIHGVIFNSAEPRADRLDILGESASQVLGFYKPRSFDNRTIAYEKDYRGGETVRLERTSDDLSWTAIPNQLHNILEGAIYK